jgi:quercetin dioxygenase-like cupin family protein
LLQILLSLATIALATAAGLVAADRGRSASTPPAPQRFDLAAGFPSFAKGYQLSLTTAVIPPGAGFPPHRHPGMQVSYIESGTLQFTVYRGHVDVYTGTPGTSQKLVRVLRAGQTGYIKAGQWIVETPSLWHRGANIGHKRVLIRLATLLRRGQPAAIPVNP